MGIIKSPLGGHYSPLQRLLETEKNFLQFHEAGLHKVAVNFVFPGAWLFPQYLAEKIMRQDWVGVNCGLTSLIGATNYRLLGHEVTTIKPLLSITDSHPFTGTSNERYFQDPHSNQECRFPFSAFVVHIHAQGQNSHYLGRSPRFVPSSRRDAPSAGHLLE